jgi:hypothetical protein
MWGSFKTSLLHSNLSLPPHQLWTHPSPATPMQTQRIIRITFDDGSDHVTFTPMNPGTGPYVSLLSSSRTLGSDFSHNRSPINIPNVTSVPVHVGSTPASQFHPSRLVINTQWYKVHTCRDIFHLRSSIQDHQTRHNKGVAWARYGAEMLGPGILMFLSANNVEVLAVVLDRPPFPLNCK